MLGLVVVAALVGGATGAGATWALSKKPDSAAKPKADKSSEARARDDESEAMAYRLDRLENDLRALRKQRQSTEALKKYAESLDKQGGAEGGAARDSGDTDPVTDAEDPAFELAVRSVLDRVDWEREEERKVTETKRREERAQRQTDLLTERLKLTPVQTQKVQQILVEQMNTFRSLREGDDSGTPRPSTRDEWRGRVEAIRTETERKLSQVLDAEQMGSYRAFVDEEGFGARGGRGRSRAGND